MTSANVKHNRHWRVLAGALVLAGVFAAGCRKPAEAAAASHGPEATAPPTASQPAPAETWVTVATGSLTQQSPAIGEFVARQDTRLGTLVSGRVAEVLVDVGSRVQKGDVLLRLDKTLFAIEAEQKSASVAAAKGALASAEADVEYWVKELARQRDLQERGANSPKEVDDARIAWQRAVAVRDEKNGKLLEAEQELAWAQQRLTETEIRAPYDAVVTQRFVDPGDMAATAPPTDLLELREVGQLYLEFSLPQEMRRTVGVGTPVAFTVEGVTTVPQAAQVSLVFPSLDAATRAFRCRADIDNSVGMFVAGALARVWVTERTPPDTLLLPRAALEQSPDGWQVVTADAGDSPASRRVTVGLLTDQQAEILSGLQAGARVRLPTAAVR